MPRLPQPSARTIAVVALVLLIGGVVLGRRVLDAREVGAVQDAARTAATSYVDLVATGDADDLERLWSLSAADDPAALRAAGVLLVGAEERIEVLEVGEPQAIDEPALRGLAALEDFRAVEVRYRLDGAEEKRDLVLGRLIGRSGTEVRDWRVAPFTGALGWSTWNPAATLSELYVSGVEQSADPVQVGSDEVPGQPLYPAVYDVQLRTDRWYASAPVRVAVRAGRPVPLAPLELKATEAMEREAFEQVVAAFGSCGVGPVGGCPARRIAIDAGVDVFVERGWWRGLVTSPTLTFDGPTFTMTGGVFRFVAPDGERRVRFTGRGTAQVAAHDGSPVVAIESIEETR